MIVSTWAAVHRSQLAGIPSGAIGASWQRHMAQRADRMSAH